MQCFGTFDDDLFQGTSLDQTWRLWLFQVCTEWGYFSVSKTTYTRYQSFRSLTSSQDCAAKGPPSHHIAPSYSRIPVSRVPPSKSTLQIAFITVLIVSSGIPRRKTFRRASLAEYHGRQRTRRLRYCRRPIGYHRRRRFASPLPRPP